MKPTRGLSGSWLSSLPPERRTALVSLAALLLLLGSLMAYQRFTEGKAPAEELGGNATPELSGQPAAGANPGPTLGLDSTETQVAVAPPRQLLRPLASKPRILKRYGYAFSETYGDFRLHPAIDYEARHGEAVLAAAAGKVISIEDDPAEGRMLTLEHPGGMSTRYAGLGKVMVNLNSTVRAGDTIGHVGDPGLAKLGLGAQLGFSVWLQGDPVDPSPYLSEKN